MTKNITEVKIEKLGMKQSLMIKFWLKWQSFVWRRCNSKVDFERLKAELADVVDEKTYETYEFKLVTV